MTVIWGLDLKELQWGKFKSSYMFKNREYHCRRTKFIVYQVAMITCVISESVGTATLSNYLDQQEYLQRANSTAYEYNNDYVGMDSYNIFAGVFVAFIFGAAFFFDLFWPERDEIYNVRLAWKVCSVLASIFMLGSVVTKTVIVSTRAAYVSGVHAEVAKELLSKFKGGTPPLKYSHSVMAINSLVFAWIGFISVVTGTILMWKTISHIEAYGPFSTHARQEKMAAKQSPDDEEAGIKAQDGPADEGTLASQSESQDGKAKEAQQQPHD